jgi:hypothetical protein
MRLGNGSYSGTYRLRRGTALAETSLVSRPCHGRVGGELRPAACVLGARSHMSFRKSFITTALVILGFTASPSPASADWLFTPFIGTTFNAAANFNDAFEGGDDFEQQFTYGASLGWMGAGIVGFEFDFGYSPNFFETAVTDDDDFEFVDDSNVTTLMANVIVGAPIGGQSGFGIRPFGVAARRCRRLLRRGRQQ